MLTVLAHATAGKFEFPVCRILSFNSLDGFTPGDEQV